MTGKRQRWEVMPCGLHERQVSRHPALFCALVLCSCSVCYVCPVHSLLCAVWKCTQRGTEAQSNTQTHTYTFHPHTRYTHLPHLSHPKQKKNIHLYMRVPASSTHSTNKHDQETCRACARRERERERQREREEGRRIHADKS